MLIGFLTAAMVGLVLTATVRWCAPRLGLVDHPDGRRKLHGKVTPLGGGVAVFLASLCALGVLCCWDPSIAERFTIRSNLFLGLLAGSSVLVTIGLLDDLVGLRGRHKLVGQFVAALCVCGGGIVINDVRVFDWSIQLGVLAIPITVFWLLGAVNSINLLDGIDGLAGTIGLILSVTIAILASWAQQPATAIVAIVFAGAIAGFLWFNLPPASIFLGDTGSMLIGLVAGTLALGSSLKGPGTALLAAPMAIWTIPILDTGAAIIRRKLAGRSIYSTDRGHLHHRLSERFGNRLTLVIVAGCATVTCVSAVVSVALKADEFALVCCAALVAMLAATRVFGHCEAELVLSRVSRATRGLFSGRSTGRRKPHWERAVRLQGSHEWESIWKLLTGTAERLGFVEIALDLNIPTLDEGYHARWSGPGGVEDEEACRLQLPLVHAGQYVGSLRATTSTAADARLDDQLARFAELVEPFSAEFRAAADGLFGGAHREPPDVTPTRSTAVTAGTKV